MELTVVLNRRRMFMKLISKMLPFVAIVIAGIIAGTYRKSDRHYIVTKTLNELGGYEC